MTPLGVLPWLGPAVEGLGTLELGNGEALLVLGVAKAEPRRWELLLCGGTSFLTELLEVDGLPRVGVWAASLSRCAKLDVVAGKSKSEFGVPGGGPGKPSASACAWSAAWKNSRFPAEEAIAKGTSPFSFNNLDGSIIG